VAVATRPRGEPVSVSSRPNGQLARATGEPWAASLVNVAVGFTALGLVALVTLATSSLDAMPANPLLSGGGLLGAYVVVVGATAVRTLGVLRLGLAVVAGQMSGALVVDLIAPRRGRGGDGGDGDRRRADDRRGRDQRARAAELRASLPLGGPMPSARAQRQSWPLTQDVFGVVSRLAESLLAPRGARDELDEARELLAYWETRARRLPRWAVMRRREARAMAWRWRERVRVAEQARYGRGLVGAASQLAIERRMPTALAHRGRQAARLAAYTAVSAAITLALVAAAAVAVIADAVLGAL
jgi:uncharacterized membrane protein YdcZ (DUF606 family)